MIDFEIVCSWADYKAQLVKHFNGQPLIFDIANNLETPVFIRAKTIAESVGFEDFALVDPHRQRSNASPEAGPLFSTCGSENSTP